MPLGNFLLNLSFFVLLLLLPNQLGLHFWPSWTTIQGLRLDYLSPTFYLSYILAAPILAAAFFIRKRSVRKQTAFKKTIVPTLFALVIPLTLLTSVSPVVSLSKLCSAYLFIAIAVVVTKLSRRLGWGWAGLAFAVAWTSILSVTQFLFQHSLGLWILGERDISAATPGVARAYLNFHLINFQGLILRPYATFSHPNSLAGFLLVSLFLLIVLRRRFPPLLLFLSLPLALMAITLSISRTAIATLLFLGLIFLQARLLSYKKIFFGSLAVISVIAIFTLLLPWWKPIPPNISSDQSLARRLEENMIAASIFKSNTIFGVGLGNFLTTLGKIIPSQNYPNLSSPVLWLQPVHNIYLLIADETGISGLITVGVFLLATLQKLIRLKNLALLFAFEAILLTGTFDHYWLTLIQNQLLLTFVFAIIWESPPIA